MLDFPQLPLLFLRRLESLFRPRHQRLGRRAQPGILCQAREAMHGVLFAPAAKARVALEDDFHLRPRLPQPRDQQLQNRPRVAGGATITGSQTRHEQLFTTKNAERQETVVAVVTRQVRAFLPAMPPISRGGEVEEQPGGRRAERSDALIHPNPVQRPGGGVRPTPPTPSMPASRAATTRPRSRTITACRTTPIRCSSW